MAFNIILYKFNKKVNSTKVPVNSTPSISLTCNIKTSSSIINPRVELKENPIGYNYCYIEKFNRYYFINNISYNIGLWVLDLNVDVLASFKTNILASSQYVSRSFSNYDRNIIDSIYPLKATHSSSMVSAKGNVIRDNDPSDIHPSYFTRAYSEGYFVISILSPNNTGISYYALSYLGFKSLITNLMTYVPSDITDVSSGMAKAIYDPIQYINSCYWYPERPKGTSTSSSLNIGSYNITLDTPVWNVSSNIETYSILIDIPKHPESVTYSYLNCEPYSFYNLIFEPFGTLAIDSTKIFGMSELKLEWLVDYGNGVGKLNIYGSNNVILDSVDGSIGVNIPIAQVTTDTLGGVSNVVSSGLGLVSNLLSGNIVGALANTFTGVCCFVFEPNWSTYKVYTL